MRLTKKILKVLDKVNRDINHNVRYTSDQEQFNKPDFIEIVENAGDCDDYAATKRSILRKKYPEHKSDFRLVKCQVETGGWHMVLMVITHKGAYALDNRFPEVTPWKDLGYTNGTMEPITGLLDDWDVIE